MSQTPSDPFFFQQEEETDFNLKELLFKYLAYWKWFVVSLVIALLAAFIYLKYQTPVYNVQTSILIKDEKKGLGQDDMLKQLDMFSANKVVDNEIEILKSFTLMEKVVTALNLQVSYFAKQNFKDEELYARSPVKIQFKEINDLAFEEPLKFKLINSKIGELNGQKIPLNREVKTPWGTLSIQLTGINIGVKELFIYISPAEAVTDNLIARIQIQPSSKMSSVLLLSIEDTKPNRAKDVLNKLVEVYNMAGLEDKNEVAANTLRFIEDRLVLISKDLTDVEKSVEDFKSREGITDISAESGLFLESVQENDNQLSQIKIQQSVLNNIDQYVRNKGNTSGTVPATLGISDPTLLGLINSLSELESKRAQAITIVKADNPIVTALDDQISSIKSNLGENLQSLRNSLAITRRQLESRNQQMEGMIRTVPGKERALVDITRQQGIKNNLYVFLLQKREETALSYASAVSDSRTVDKARGSNTPVKPVKRNIYLLFALIGLAIPFAIIYLIDLLNDKIKNRKEIEKATNAPILADISYADHEEALVVSKLGRTVMAEQIRALRTNISFLNPGKGVQSILFTSSMSGEGKSFISLNLGASLAMTDKKTVILELDMRKPKLHSSLGMSNPAGLSNYLVGSSELKDIIRPVPGQENYFIITCGPIPPNPAELLLNGRLQELFSELRAAFDYIIIDAPPVGIVTDAQILEQQADATLFVLRHDYTPKERLKMVDNLYRENKFKNLSLVFNAVKEGGKYGYGYGYGYGYYEQEKESPNLLTSTLNGFKKEKIK
ncbi:GumC family protein [Daejeonella oryzae]|uniref:GumC family protein n=1 Tax=Daejeonella oryzae TaxID=1122943 RepID=UPI0003F576FE|nr:polysaccharide biosynthesis tyrosine autokinase [Daejeonella oryzae]